MLYFDRTDVSKGTDINKTKECNICHVWYFLDEGFKVETYVCNGCHYVLMTSMILSDIVILSINGIDLCCIIKRITSFEVVSLV